MQNIQEDVTNESKIIYSILTFLIENNFIRVWLLPMQINRYYH